MASGSKLERVRVDLPATTTIPTDGGDSQVSQHDSQHGRARIPNGLSVGEESGREEGIVAVRSGRCCGGETARNKARNLARNMTRNMARNILMLRASDEFSENLPKPSEVRTKPPCF